MPSAILRGVISRGAAVTRGRSGIEMSCCTPGLGRESERVALLHDLPSRWRGKMRPENDDVGVGVLLAERAPCLLRHRAVGIESDVPFGISALNRMMHQIAGDQASIPFRRNPAAGMSGSVAGRRLEPYFVGDAKVRVDQIGHPNLNNRTHRILDRIAHVLAVELRPVIPLGAAYQVAGVGERRHPLAVLEHRVPPDMVHVQMRADDAIDLVARVTRFSQVAQKRQLQIAPRRVRTNLLVADAGVDDDALTLRLDHQRVDAHAELALFVGEGGIEPVGFLQDILGGGVSHDEGARPWRLALDDAGYLDVADFELVHSDSSISAQLSRILEIRQTWNPVSVQ